MEALLEEKEKEIVKKGEWLQVSFLGILKGNKFSYSIFGCGKVTFTLLNSIFFFPPLKSQKDTIAQLTSKVQELEQQNLQQLQQVWLTVDVVWECCSVEPEDFCLSSASHKGFALASTYRAILNPTLN